MKIAVSGKGGVGKSTIAAALATMLARKGHKVLALDADPDANFASALGMGQGMRKKIVPISEQIDLIEQRTGTTVNEYGRVFKLNPDVSDIAEKFSVNWEGINVIVLGAVQKGGSGCACPESTFIRALVTDLVLYKNQTLIMDMEAGIEHLGRATAHGVDVMIVVVEPGQRSIDCANTISRMAHEIGIKRLVYVGNKITRRADEEFIKKSLTVNRQGDENLLAALIPYSEDIRNADRECVSVLDMASDEMLEKFELILRAVDNNLR